MGIKDLLKVLEKDVEVTNISRFRGGKVAIDASGWLHKSLWVSVDDYVDSNFGKDEQLYVDFFVTRITNMRLCGTEPVFVFDGKRHAMKGETQAKRRDARQTFLEQGHKLLRNISQTADIQCKRKLRTEAVTCFQRGLTVTHEMERAVISALRRMDVTVIVAPYEADVQLAYLCRIGMCQAILTEDSDVMVYAAITGMSIPILYKFDKSGMVHCLDINCILNGAHTEELSMTGGTGSQSNTDSQGSSASFSSITSKSSTSSSSTTSTSAMLRTGSVGVATTRVKSTKMDSAVDKLRLHFSGQRGRRMFVQLCILAGCDYSESLRGMGFLTALDMVVKFHRVDANSRIHKICSAHQQKGKKDKQKTLPVGYLDRARRAEHLFFYQLVYDPIDDCLKPFSTQGDTECYSTIDKEDTDWLPPASEEDLRRVGTHADVMSLADINPSAGGVGLGDLLTPRDVCTGLRSWRDGTSIPRGFPWELDRSLGELPARAGGILRNCSHAWHTRVLMVKQFGGSKQKQQQHHHHHQQQHKLRQQLGRRSPFHVGVRPGPLSFGEEFSCISPGYGSATSDLAKPPIGGAMGAAEAEEVSLPKHQETFNYANFDASPGFLAVSPSPSPPLADPNPNPNPNGVVVGNGLPSGMRPPEAPRANLSGQQAFVVHVEQRASEDAYELSAAAATPKAPRVLSAAAGAIVDVTQKTETDPASLPPSTSSSLSVHAPAARMSPSTAPAASTASAPMPLPAPPRIRPRIGRQAGQTTLESTLPFFTTMDKAAADTNTGARAGAGIDKGIGVGKENVGSSVLPPKVPGLTSTIKAASRAGQQARGHSLFHSSAPIPSRMGATTAMAGRKRKAVGGMTSGGGGKRTIASYFAAKEG